MQGALPPKSRKGVADQTGNSTELQKKFRASLVFTKIYPRDTYEVADLRENILSRRVCNYENLLEKSQSTHDERTLNHQVCDLERASASEDKKYQK